MRTFGFWVRAALTAGTLGTGCTQASAPAADAQPASSSNSVADSSFEAQTPRQPADSSECIVVADASSPLRDIDSALSWQDQIRMGRWSRAKTAIERLPPEQSNRPEVRYARAKIELALGNFESALGIMHGVENALPELRADIAKQIKCAERGGCVRDRAASVARKTQGHKPPTDQEVTLDMAPATTQTAESKLAQARALYASRTQYDKAAEMFAEVGHARASLADECTYFAARSWSRANDNNRARDGYRKLKKHASAIWAERAEYQLARLDMLEGKWTEAANGYQRYLSAHSSGTFGNDARYELAISDLASQQGARAIPILEKQARAQSDQLVKACLKQLGGVALHQTGAGDEAISLWTELSSANPYSWPSAMALLRQGKLETIDSVPIAALAKRTSSEAVRLPQPARILAQLGFDTDAQDTMRAQASHKTGAAIGLATAEDRCNSYSQLQIATDGLRFARRKIASNWLLPAPNPSNYWAWTCLYPRPYSAWITALEHQLKLPFGLLYAVMRQESAFDPDAISPAGAKGLMQLLEQTAARLEADPAAETVGAPFDEPWRNIELGALYLSKLMEMFDGRVVPVVAAYNAGPEAVARWVNRNSGLEIDLWVAAIPYSETRRYVAEVMTNLLRYRVLYPEAEPGLPLRLSLNDHVRLAPEAY